MKTVKASELRPGMVLDVWYLPPGPGSTVKSVKVLDRPGFRYRTVWIETADGKVIRPYPTENMTFKTRRVA